MIQYDDNQTTLTVDDKAVKLQPLSYRLFKELYSNQDSPINNNELVSAVWGNVNVSADTLKQRIFLLRKSLEEAGITNITIQAVRGEGYRLSITQDTLARKQELSSATEADKTTSLKTKLLKKWFLTAMLATIAIASVSTAYYFSSMPTQERQLSNRTVLWANMPITDFPKDSAALYENWRSQLIKSSNKGELQLLQSVRIPELLISKQSRKVRAAVVSYFEIVDLGDRSIASLQIIEPSTATILRNDTLNIGDKDQLEQIFNNHLSGLKNLTSSKQFLLTEEHRSNAQHPIWEELRKLANPVN